MKYATSVTDFQVTGILWISMYSILGLATASRIYLHIRHNSGTARVLFHVVLLKVIVFSMPKSAAYIWMPTTESWILTYVTSLYAMLLLNLALSYVCVEWAGVAATGQNIGMGPQASSPCSLRNVVIVVNVSVFAWAVATCISIVSYPDTSVGGDAFRDSPLRSGLVVVGCTMYLATTILLIVQGLKIRTRLLQSQRFVSEQDFHRSMVKLVLSVGVITGTTWIRLLFKVLAAFGVSGFADMPLLPFEVWSELVPTVFPVLCLLYLQRRLPLEATSPDTGCATTTLPHTTTSTLSV
ncbi:hypothetical protein AaE_009192 [Aphanomyces astaci]|uniref:THH1/TOM1/TOM3 domain-containing protein n=1 Tax=Aphanomyces astaci TaxID=112090 RepID=A0A6A5A906_APHAT|nr:hypothetical protein AaE_009192 [Aphanomyces astaci]